jgi:plastocyanin
MQPTDKPTNEINQPIVSPEKTSSHKKKLLIVLIVLLAVVVGMVAIILSQSKTATNKDRQSTALVDAPAIVNVTNTGFVPATISIKAGQAIQWTNKDTVNHQVASGPHPSDDALVGLNNDAVMQPEDSFSYTFEKAGTYNYHDELNPLLFKGTIIVE